MSITQPIPLQLTIGLPYGVSDFSMQSQSSTMQCTLAKSITVATWDNEKNEDDDEFKIEDDVATEIDPDLEDEDELQTKPEDEEHETDDDDRFEQYMLGEDEDDDED